MITIATLFWDANDASYDFSRSYDELWVTKLYNGFARNLTVPWRFVLFTNRYRELHTNIKQELLRHTPVGYASCIEPYRYGVPMILCGLDTVVTGNCDHLAEYCHSADKIGLPRDPYRMEQACNGVALVPGGFQSVYRNWRGENDMEWMRRQPHVFLDDLFPGQIVSYKGYVKAHGLGDARIVYFHGREKPHELPDVSWIGEHWR